MMETVAPHGKAGASGRDGEPAVSKADAKITPELRAEPFWKSERRF
ncbi:MAG: hypothetical protein ACLR8P_13070 [Clostridium fessum]